VKRAFTIVEVLLALALLGVLTVAGVSWAQMALRAGAETGAVLGWRSAAEAALDLIADDLTTGDTALRGLDGGLRIQVVAQDLRIVERDGAAGSEPLLLVYHLDPDSRAITRAEVAPRARAAGRAPGRLVLGEVGGFERTVAPDSRSLRITITHTDGKTAAREYPLR
jgi:prepilin-type N-terminal cleavage/methylation domain-containing protein